MTKMIYGNVTMAQNSKLSVTNENAAEIVKQGLEQINADFLCKIICDKLVESNLFDKETYETLKKLYKEDYSQIITVIGNKE